STAGGDGQPVRGIRVSVDDLNADLGAGGDGDGRVGQAGEAKGLIGAASRAGQDGEPDAGAGEGDPVRGAVQYGTGRDLAAEPDGLRGADPGAGGVREQRAHDLPRV